MKWKISGWGNEVANYNIGPLGRRSHSVEAWWYDIIITHKGKTHQKQFYGGGSSVWAFYEQGIFVINGPAYRSSEAQSPVENGVISVPLDHPTVKAIVSHFKNLELTGS